MRVCARSAVIDHSPQRMHVLLCFRTCTPTVAWTPTHILTTDSLSSVGVSMTEPCVSNAACVAQRA